MFLSQFKELVAFPLLHKFLHHVPTVFILLELHLQLPPTHAFPSVIAYLRDERQLDLTVQ